MTPSELREYLQVFKDLNVASAQLTVAGSAVSVVFGPEPLTDGVMPPSGGWKSPARLDDPAQFDEAP